MNVRLEKMPFSDAKIFFSRTTDFGEDYIQYHWYPDGPGIEIYHKRPDTFHVVYDDGIEKIKTKDFHIFKIKDDSFTENYQQETMSVDSTSWWSRSNLTTLNDSVIIPSTQYLILVWGTQWFEVFNTKGDVVFKRQ